MRPNANIFLSTFFLQFQKTDSTFCESAVSCGYPTNLVSSSGVENILKVYPNPAKDILYIDLGAAYKNTTLQIYNAVGDIVLTEHLTTQNSSLPTHHLTSGIYFYKAVSGDKVVQNKLVIIK